MQHRYTHKFLQIGLTSFLLAASFSLFAESEPEDIIKYRQNGMKASAAHMASMAAIIQGKVSYSAQLADHAKAVQALNKNIPALFPDGSDFGETKALDAVWKDKADFAKRAKDTEAKSAALAQAVKGGDPKLYEPKFKELSESCKACHKDFRKKEEK